jgi:hypothetical protein
VCNVDYLLIDVELVDRAQLILERSQALPPAPRIDVNNVMGLLGACATTLGRFFSYLTEPLAFIFSSRAMIDSSFSLVGIKASATSTSGMVSCCCDTEGSGNTFMIDQ